LTVTATQDEIREELENLLLRQAELLGKIKKGLKKGNKQEILNLIDENGTLSKEITDLAENLED